MSQEEIDALLNSLAGGGDEPEPEKEPVPAAAPVAAVPVDASYAYAAPMSRPAPKKTEIKYKHHDFANPKIFTKEQLRILQIVYDTYSKYLSSFMSGKLRTECTISITAIEEMRYYEYNNSLPDSIMMGVLEARPLEGSMLIEINKEMAYLIIEKLMGWVGDKPDVPESDFTDIEIKICEKFYTEITKYLKDAWANVTDMEPRFDRVETNARLTQIMSLDDIIILVSLTVKVNEYEGSMRVCVPCLNLDSLLAESENYLKIKRKKKNEDIEKTKKDIFENLKTSRVDVRGVLGNATVSLQELLYLQVGDYITLDSAKDSLITLKVGSLDWYQGEIGTKNNRMAVKIINELQAKKEMQKIL
jgi:flagellar motor switch protein FliM